MNEVVENQASDINSNLSKNGDISLNNPHLKLQKKDVLYHLGLSTDQNLVEMFNDVKFICLGGSSTRMEQFAKYIKKELGFSQDESLEDIADTDRYSMYKVGPVLSVSHGMGISSISILLHELIKLVHYAACTNVVFIRIGTCGGLGLDPGSVVITEAAVDEMFNSYWELSILGERIKRPAVLDPQLAQDILACADSEDGFRTVTGKTMCAMDFYETQGRLDGAFCDYTEQDKLDFLKRANEFGVKNIEMESLSLGAILHKAGLKDSTIRKFLAVMTTPWSPPVSPFIPKKGAVVCVTLLDRLKGDQVSTPHDTLMSWQERPQQLVSRYIKQQILQH